MRIEKGAERKCNKRTQKKKKAMPSCPHRSRLVVVGRPAELSDTAIYANKLYNSQKMTHARQFGAQKARLKLFHKSLKQ